MAETTHPGADDDPRTAVLQAVLDRVTSWQEGAAPETIRQELQEELARADLSLEPAQVDRIVEHVHGQGEHLDVRELLGSG